MAEGDGRDRPAAQAARCPRARSRTWPPPTAGSGWPAGSCTRRRRTARPSSVCLFDSQSSELVAVIEAIALGQLRTGAASGVAARYLAKAGARTLGVIGCGYQAETQVACIRAAVPTIERVVAYCRTPERLAAFCERVGAEPGESHRDAAAAQDVVVTITSSRDPVLRGEWLAAGSARRRGRRERRERAASSTTPSSSARASSAATGSSRREARVGRPRRARAGGRSRLARGARAARGRGG